MYLRILQTFVVGVASVLFWIAAWSRSRTCQAILAPSAKRFTALPSSLTGSSCALFLWRNHAVCWQDPCHSCLAALLPAYNIKVTCFSIWPATDMNVRLVSASRYCMCVAPLRPLRVSGWTEFKWLMSQKPDMDKQTRSQIPKCQECLPPFALVSDPLHCLIWA